MKARSLQTISRNYQRLFLERSPTAISEGRLLIENILSSKHIKWSESREIIKKLSNCEGIRNLRYIAYVSVTSHNLIFIVAQLFKKTLLTTELIRDMIATIQISS